MWQLLLQALIKKNQRYKNSIHGLKDELKHLIALNKSKSL